MPFPLPGAAPQGCQIRRSESEVRFRLKPSYTPSRQNPYLLTHAGFGTLAEQPPAGEKV